MRSLGTPLQERVVIVDHHQLVAEALELALAVEGHDVQRVDLPAGRSSPASLVGLVLRHRPRVVLQDLDLGRLGDGLRLVEPLARAGADVVVVTGSTDPARWGEAVRAGAGA